jgi:hypothetical protein
MRIEYWFESLKGRDHSEDLGRWEGNIQMDLWKIGLKRVDWIDLARDRDKWWALVNTVMNLWVP